MSNEKSLMMESAILERVRKITGKNSDKELAELFGLKQGNYSARKQRGSLLPVITEWAISSNVNLNWLLRGQFQEKKKLNNFLLKVEEWTQSLTQEDKNADIWFEYEFERKFPEFKEWRKEKERTRSEETETQAYKVA